MPHIRLEYSSNIAERPNPKELFSKMHQLIVAKGPFNISQIKSRASEREEFFVSDGERDQAFIHLELMLLVGQTSELKKTLSEALLGFLRREFSETEAKKNCSITVAVIEIEKEFYSKVNTGEV